MNFKEIKKKVSFQVTWLRNWYLLFFFFSRKLILFVEGRGDKTILIWGLLPVQHLATVSKNWNLTSTGSLLNVLNGHQPQQVKDSS